MIFSEVEPFTWLSDCGNYKVKWRDTVCGVKVKPAYHALVLTIAGGRQAWDFAGRFGLYSSRKSCEAACIKHHKVWDKAIKIAESPRKGRLLRLEELRQLGFDKKKSGQPRVTARRLLRALPVWVSNQCSDKVVARFFATRRRNNSDDDIE